jgi:hypothetical protein
MIASTLEITGCLHGKYSFFFFIPRLEFLEKIVQDDKMAENDQFLTGSLKDSFDLEGSFGVPVKNWLFSAILPS